MQFCKSLLHFLMARKEERAPKSQPTERGGEEAGEREKKEDRRKIFSAHTCTPIHPPTTTRTLSRRKERRKGQRERRTLVSGPLSTRVRKELVDGKEEEKRQQKVKKIFLADFQTHPSDPPPPLPHPVPTDSTN